MDDILVLFSFTQFCSETHNEIAELTAWKFNMVSSQGILIKRKGMLRIEWVPAISSFSSIPRKDNRNLPSARALSSDAVLI